MVPVILIEAAFGEVVLVEAEVMAEFMEVGGADFLEINFAIAVCKVPEHVEEKDDLAGNRVGTGRIVESLAAEETEGVWSNIILGHPGGWPSFVGDGQGSGLFAQCLGKVC